MKEIASIMSSCLDFVGSCSCPVELSERYSSLNILKLSQQFSHSSSQSKKLRLTRLCFCTLMASSTHLLSSFSFSTFSFLSSLIFRSILVFRQLQSTLKGSSLPPTPHYLASVPAIVTAIKNDYRLWYLIFIDPLRVEKIAEKALGNKTEFPSSPILKIKTVPNSPQAQRAGPRLFLQIIFSSLELAIQSTFLYSGRYQIA